MNMGDYILARLLAEIHAKQFQHRAMADYRVCRRRNDTREWLSRQGRCLLSQAGALLVTLGMRLQAQTGVDTG